MSRSFEDTVLPHLDAAFNYARWLTRNDVEAEEVVQDAYVRALRFFSNVRGTDARAWLLAIVRNAYYARGPRRVEPFAELPPDQEARLADEGLGPEALALQQERRRVRQCLDLRDGVAQRCRDVGIRGLVEPDVTVADLHEP